MNKFLSFFVKEKKSIIIIKNNTNEEYKVKLSAYSEKFPLSFSIFNNFTKLKPDDVKEINVNWIVPNKYVFAFLIIKKGKEIIVDKAIEIRNKKERIILISEEIK